MPVMSFISSKGGCGKTTALYAMADRALANKLQVTIVDADTNNFWSDFEGDASEWPENLTVVTCSDPDELYQRVKEAENSSDLVLIDTPGALDVTALTAGYVSDIIIVPVKCSKPDWLEALRTYKRLIQPGDELGHLAIRYERLRFLWSDVDTALPTIVERNLEATARESGLPFLETRMLRRAAFKSGMFFSKFLDQLTPEESSELKKKDNLKTSSFIGQLFYEVYAALGLINSHIARTDSTKKEAANV